jgi:shikimate kinase
MNQNFYIIGMPGTGKTHFGRLLSQSLRMRFLDMDEMVERTEGATIRQIVAEKGEPYFRAVEHEMLKQTLSINNCVVSCGGGTPFHYDNMELMKKHGLVLWLNTDLTIIKKRIAQNSTRRPLFLGLSEAEIHEKLKDLFDKRRRTYAKADVFIEHSFNHSIPLSAVIQKIMKHLRAKRKQL